MILAPLAAALVQIPGLALGVSAVFSESPVAYAVLKYAGAGYLVVLGFRFITSSSTPSGPATPVIYSARAAFHQGLWSNLSNPKSWVFLLAFLPQFVDPSQGGVAAQLALLGVVHKGVGTLVDGSIAIASGTAGNWLKRHERFVKWQERFVGGVLVAVGARLALETRH